MTPAQRSDARRSTPPCRYRVRSARAKASRALVEPVLGHDVKLLPDPAPISWSRSERSSKRRPSDRGRSPPPAWRGMAADNIDSHDVLLTAGSFRRAVHRAHHRYSPPAASWRSRTNAGSEAAATPACRMLPSAHAIDGFVSVFSCCWMRIRSSSWARWPNTAAPGLNLVKTPARRRRGHRPRHHDSATCALQPDTVFGGAWRGVRARKIVSVQNQRSRPAVRSSASTTVLARASRRCRLGWPAAVSFATSRLASSRANSVDHGAAAGGRRLPPP